MPPRPEYLRLVREIVLDVWKQKQADVVEISRRLQSNHGALLDKKDRIVEASTSTKCTSSTRKSPSQRQRCMMPGSMNWTEGALSEASHLLARTVDLEAPTLQWSSGFCMFFPPKEQGKRPRRDLKACSFVFCGSQRSKGNQWLRGEISLFVEAREIPEYPGKAPQEPVKVKRFHHRFATRSQSQELEKRTTYEYGLWPTER